MSRKFFIRNLIVVATLLVTISACSTSEKKYNKNIEYVEVVGDLVHTQYWDYNDSWDLTGLQLVLHFEDESLEYVDASSKHATYTFEPSSPVGLSHDVTSFELVTGYYQYNGNKKANITGRKFEPISIVDYPYQKPKLDRNTIIEAAVFGGIVLLVLALAIILYFKKKKRGK